MKRVQCHDLSHTHVADGDYTRCDVHGWWWKPPTEEFCLWLQRAQVSNGEQPMYLQGDEYLRCVAGFISDAS